MRTPVGNAISQWISLEDTKAIMRIVKKAFAAANVEPGQNGYLDATMSVEAAHAVTPLDLARMDAPSADAYSVAHDVFGIFRHLDHATGELRDCFVPRYTR